MTVVVRDQYDLIHKMIEDFETRFSLTLKDQTLPCKPGLTFLQRADEQEEKGVYAEAAAETIGVILFLMKTHLDDGANYPLSLLAAVTSGWPKAADSVLLHLLGYFKAALHWKQYNVTCSRDFRNKKLTLEAQADGSFAGHPDKTGHIQWKLTLKGEAGTEQDSAIAPGLQSTKPSSKDSFTDQWGPTR